MNVEYIGRNFHADEALHRFVEEKLHKVAKFLEEPVEIRVTLAVEKNRHAAEVHVAHRLGVLQATEETLGPMTDAIHQAIEKIASQARRSRKKLVGKKRRAGANGHENRWPVEVVEAGSVGGGGVPRIIESTHLSIKPMTIEEAALALETSREGFVVFRDAATERVSVLYRRHDDNYGLIAPEL